MATILKERYETGAVLGESACAVTRIAYDRLLRQRVVVKEFYPRELVYREENGNLCVLPGKDAEAFAREKDAFFEELSVVFGHYELLGMAAVKDYFKENNTVYVVTEHLTGGSLEEYLGKMPKKRLTCTEAVKLLLPVMEALTFLHSKGIVHGGITADRLRFDENGICRFTGIGTCFRRRISMEKGAAPEQRRDAGQTGPWSDVYGVCAVLYRMCAGRSITDARRRFRKDRVRSLSAYAKVEEALEAAVMQGLEPELQKRYFYPGALAERLGEDSGQMRPFLGEVQAQWGELWLQLCLDGEEAAERKRRVLFTRRQKKAFLAGTACLTGICLAGLTGLSLYGETHPKERLQFHLQQDRRYAQKHPVKEITRETEGYETLLEYLKTEGTAEEYTTGTRYALTKEEAKKQRLTGNGGNKFPVREDTFREALELALSEKFTESTSVEQEAFAAVSSGKLGKIEAVCEESTEYAFAKEQGFFVRITSDLIDRRVTGLEVQGDRTICKKVVTEILPVLVPETYFTEDEAEELCLRAEEKNYISVHHGLYSLVLHRYEMSEKPPVWKVEMYACRYYGDGEVFEKAAGNYARGSKEYEQFRKFLKEHAAASKDVNGAVTYTLTEEDVLKWGQPSNQYMLSLTRTDFLAKMRDCGYVLTPGKTAGDYRVIDEKYGIFRSLFDKKEDFSLGETLKMRVISDPVSEKINTVGIHSEAGNLQETAACAADAVRLISKDLTESREELEAVLLEHLEDYRREMTENPENRIYSGEACTDCICSFTDVDGSYYIIISRTDTLTTLYRGQPETALYFWPATADRE